MADVFSKKKRSQVMAAVHSTGNKVTEANLAKLFRRNGIKGWRCHLFLAGKPDFTFRTQRVALFVDGCFWHGCPKHLRMPASNRGYWRAKIARNRVRDKAIMRELRKSGWRALRVWEHELRDCQRVLKRITSALASGSMKLRHAA
jgi:DNA mismatch endonuclease (patch repair protein)